MAEAEVAQRRVTGGCQCGAVRYSVKAALDDVNICHCRMCQKAGGAPYMAFFGVPTTAVTWTRGRPATFASSSLATRGFCRDCGTPLTYQRQPGSIGLTTGSLDDTAVAVPTTRLSGDTVLPWCEDIRGLPMTPMSEWQASSGVAPFHNNQHPDHDT